MATCASGRPPKTARSSLSAPTAKWPNTAAFEAAPAHGDVPEAKLNGKLTLGENTADNGGLRIAYMALLDVLAKEGKTIDDKIDGYTEAQRYFLGFAQVWCQNETEQAARQSAHDRSALARDAGA